jgi:hypothetical protein
MTLKPESSPVEILGSICASSIWMQQVGRFGETAWFENIPSDALLLLLE